MDDKNYSQLELFSHQPGHSEPRSALAGSILRRIRIYEKAILLAIGFIITAVVAFSLGIEKGKGSAVLKSDVRSDITGKKQPLAQSSRLNFIPRQEQATLERKPQAVISKPESTIPQKPGEKPQNYTIQLASYKSASYAQKEAEALKKRGLGPVIVSKGKYTVLCVGNFSDKENARSLLLELEKQYHGCFIRRI